MESYMVDSGDERDILYGKPSEIYVDFPYGKPSEIYVDFPYGKFWVKICKKILHWGHKPHVPPSRSKQSGALTTTRAALSISRSVHPTHPL